MLLWLGWNMQMSGSDMADIKGVLLDLDNTLYDYDICNSNALKKIFLNISKKYNISKEEVEKSFYAARAQVKSVLGGTAASHSRLLYFKKMIEALTGKTDAEYSLELEQMFWSEYFDHMDLKEDAKRFLDYCKKNKIKIVVITDLTTEIQLRKVNHVGISKYVDFIITSEEVGKEKPHPDIFNAALAKINSTPEGVIIIGDDEQKDILPAKKLGIKYYKSFKDIKLDLTS